jgi:hypothetical protein
VLCAGTHKLTPGFGHTEGKSRKCARSALRTSTRIYLCIHIHFYAKKGASKRASARFDVWPARFKYNKHSTKYIKHDPDYS